MGKLLEKIELKSGDLGLDPTKIITFNEKYFQNLKELMELLKSNRGEPIEIYLKRITQNGYKIVLVKLMVREIKSNGFSYIFFDQKDETKEKQTFFCRFDNVLGEVPILPKYKDISIFTTNKSFPEIKKFYQEKVYKKLKKYEGKNVTVHLYFTYGPGHIFYGKTHCSFGHFQKINRSNVEYHHIQTFVLNKNGKEYDYNDYLFREEIDRFIAPDRLLTRVVIRDGLTNFNQFDDE